MTVETSPGLEVILEVEGLIGTVLATSVEMVVIVLDVVLRMGEVIAALAELVEGLIVVLQVVVGVGVVAEVVLGV